MKRQLLFLMVSVMALTVFAQRHHDISVDSILEPTELRTIEDGQAIKTNWPIHVVLTNHGPDALNAGDTIVWAARLTDKVSGTVKADIPGQGRVYALVMDRAKAANDTIHFSVDLSLTGGLQFSRDYIMTFVSGGYSGKDTVTANNVLTKEIVWYDLNNRNVSIDDADFASNIKVTPNPATTEMVITLLEVNFRSALVELYDMTGQLVHSSDQTMLDKSYRINTSELANGMYILKVTDGEKVSATRVSVSH